jgi:hypothetical protein
VDAAGYGSLDNLAQHDLQTLLTQVLDEAALAAGLDRSRWLKQPQGDGELALIPPDQPEPRLVDDFIRELDAVLLHRNHGRVSASRLRLRAAIGFGVAFEASAGFAGAAVVATARLLNSQSLHEVLAAASDADLAVALSDDVYQTVLNRHTSLTADQFCPAEVTEKEFSGMAWIRVLSRGAPRIADPCVPASEPATVAQASGPAARPAEAHVSTVKNTFDDTVEADVIGIRVTTTRDGRP